MPAPATHAPSGGTRTPRGARLTTTAPEAAAPQSPLHATPTAPAANDALPPAGLGAAASSPLSNAAAAPVQQGVSAPIEAPEATSSAAGRAGITTAQRAYGLSALPPSGSASAAAAAAVLPVAEPSDAVVVDSAACTSTSPPHKFGQWYASERCADLLQLRTHHYTRQLGDMPCSACTKPVAIGVVVYAQRLPEADLTQTGYICHRRCFHGPLKEAPMRLQSDSVYHTLQHPHALVCINSDDAPAFKCTVCAEEGSGVRLQCDSCSWECHPQCLEPMPESDWEFGELLQTEMHEHPVLLMWDLQEWYGDRWSDFTHFTCDVCGGNLLNLVFYCNACSWAAHPECLREPITHQHHPCAPIQPTDDAPLPLCTCCRPSTSLLELLHRAVVVRTESESAGSGATSPPAPPTSVSYASPHASASGWPYVQDLVAIASASEYRSGLLGAACLFVLDHCPSRSVDARPGHHDDYELPLYQLCLCWYAGDEPAAVPVLRNLLERLWQDTVRFGSMDAAAVLHALSACLAPCTASFHVNAPTHIPLHLVQLIPLNYSFRLSDSPNMGYQTSYFFYRGGPGGGTLPVEQIKLLDRPRSGTLVAFLLERCPAGLNAHIEARTSPLHLAAAGFVSRDIIGALCSADAKRRHRLIINNSTTAAATPVAAPSNELSSMQFDDRIQQVAGCISAIDAGLAAAADSYGLYPFHHACMSAFGPDDCAVLRLLFEAYPTPDEAVMSGNAAVATIHPIVLAVHSNMRMSTEAFAFLLDSFPCQVLETRFETACNEHEIVMLPISLRLLSKMKADSRFNICDLDEWFPGGGQRGLLLPVQILLQRRGAAISVPLLRVFLDHAPETALCVDAEGRNLLHLAIEIGCSLDVIRYLARPELLQQADYKGFLPLHRLCEQPRVSLRMLEVLVEAFPQALERRTLSRSCDLPLHVLCRARNFRLNPLPLRLLRLVINRFPAAVRTASNVADSCHTPLHLALRSKAPFGVLQLLLRTDPQAIVDYNSDRETPAHFLAKHGCAPTGDEPFDLRCIDLILRADPSALAKCETRHGRTPGHLCTKPFTQANGLLSFFRLLPTPYSTLLMQDARRNLPIHLAVASAVTPNQVAVLLFGEEGDKWQDVQAEVDQQYGGEQETDKTGNRSRERRMAQRVAAAHAQACAVGDRHPSSSHAATQLHRFLSATVHTSEHSQPSTSTFIASCANSDGHFPLQCAVQTLRLLKPNAAQEQDHLQALHMLIEAWPSALNHGRPLSLLAVLQPPLLPAASHVVRVAASCSLAAPMQAILEHWPDAVHIMVPIEAQEAAGQSTLHFAARLGGAEVMQLLVRRAPQLTKHKDKHGHLPLFYLLERIQAWPADKYLADEMVSLLKPLLASVSDAQSLHEDAELRRMLETAPFWQLSGGAPPLAGLAHVVLAYSDLPVDLSDWLASLLLLRNPVASVLLTLVCLQPSAFSARSYQDLTMLGLAARENHVRACELLLRANASVLAIDALGKIPLDHCVSKSGACFELLKRETCIRRLYRGRYELDGAMVRGGKHVVLFGTDSQAEHKRVALKLFEHETEFRSELAAHVACAAPLPEAVAPVARHVSNGRPIVFVAPIVESFCDAAKEIPPDLRQLEGGTQGEIGLGVPAPTATLCNFCIVMEAGTMDLEAVLSKKERVELVAFKFIAFNLASCLLQLHLRQWVHGDFKLRNVVKMENDTFQLIDFDTSRQFDMPMGDSCTPRYCPPEKAKILCAYANAAPEQRAFKSQLGPAAHPSYDMFSLGCVLFEVATRRPLFHETDRSLLLDNMARADDQYIRRRVMSNDVDIPEEVSALLLKLLCVEPDQRLTARQLLSHSLFKSSVSDTAMQRTYGALQHSIQQIDASLLSVSEKIDVGFENLSHKADVQLRALLEVHVTDLPRLFTLLPERSKAGSSVLDQLRCRANRLDPFDRYRLVFCCQGVGAGQDELNRTPCMHAPKPLHEGYLIETPGEFIQKAAPVLKACNLLLKAVSVAGKCVGIPIPYGLPLVDQLAETGAFDLLDCFIDDHALINTASGGAGAGAAEPADLKLAAADAYTALKRLLDTHKIDWRLGVGNLQKVIDPATGHALFVCSKHAELFLSLHGTSAPIRASAAAPIQPAARGRSWNDADAPTSTEGQVSPARAITEAGKSKSTYTAREDTAPVTAEGSTYGTQPDARSALAAADAGAGAVTSPLRGPALGFVSGAGNGASSGAGGAVAPSAAHGLSAQVAALHLDLMQHHAHVAAQVNTLVQLQAQTHAHTRSKLNQMDEGKSNACTIL